MAQVQLAPNQFQNSLTAASAETPDGSVPAGELTVPVNGSYGNAASASIAISGTFVATIVFEASGDGGLTWFPINAFPPNATVAVVSATAPGLWQLAVSSLTSLRARCSAFTSGIAVATINLSTAPFLG